MDGRDGLRRNRREADLTEGKRALDHPKVQKGSALEVLKVAVRLGLTPFGGPIAHLGYYREEYVIRRNWLDEKTFADLVSLCQMLPGPASSQVGIAIGLIRPDFRGRWLFGRDLPFPPPWR